MNKEIIEKVTKSCNEIFADQKNYKLPDEYNYGHLPLCVIDSIFSIGVKYEAVKNVVNRFCDHYKIDKSSNTEELTTSHFLELMEQQTVQELAENIYKNRQRTSTVSGILKSEAVVLFLKVLQKYKVESLNDIDKIITNDQFEIEIKKISGQKSGISLQYFFMLAGSDDLIKPDRMILRFLENILEEKVSLNDCQVILTGVTEQLKNNGFNITAKKLDNLIWNYQRDIQTDSPTIQDDTL
ncbi:hypothetical protein FNW52_03525 [Flavobacterium sp. ZT3R18]|uniref:hypothetical protein n=1 Tax=Flavobacterium sp. ZT3R18 TaxID=2594429 RepID=UPI00117ABEA9|nr:hypothetical protein [Flavobacterium sp. ZT3R18]TRX37981.1 hypothetical protein FNW52_03525 [Flavobacterium sp. ZT3R18]